MLKVGVQRSLRHRTLLTMVMLWTQWACCTQLGPVVAHGDLTRDEVTQQLGTPTVREVTTATEVLARELIQDRALAERVKQLEPQTRLEILKWQAACWTGNGDYFIGLFDPVTGRILVHSGKPLFAGRTQLG